MGRLELRGMLRIWFRVEVTVCDYESYSLYVRVMNPIKSG